MRNFLQLETLRIDVLLGAVVFGGAVFWLFFLLGKWAIYGMEMSGYVTAIAIAVPLGGIVAIAFAFLVVRYIFEDRALRRSDHRGENGHV